MATTSEKLLGADWIAIILVVIGTLNWGLVGLFGVDAVAAIFGRLTLPSRIIYLIVALAGLYIAFVSRYWRSIFRARTRSYVPGA